jgi:hypothetical protein
VPDPDNASVLFSLNLNFNLNLNLNLDLDLDLVLDLCRQSAGLILTGRHTLCPLCQLPGASVQV